MSKYRTLFGPLSDELVRQKVYTNNGHFYRKDHNIIRGGHFQYNPLTTPHLPATIGVNHRTPQRHFDNKLSFTCDKEAVHSMIRPYTGDNKHRLFYGKRYRFHGVFELGTEAVEEAKKGEMICPFQLWGSDYEGHTQKNPPIALLVYNGGWRVQHYSSCRLSTPFKNKTTKLDTNKFPIDNTPIELEVIYEPDILVKVSLNGKVVHKKRGGNTIWNKDQMGPIPMFGNYYRGPKTTTVNWYDALFQERIR